MATQGGRGDRFLRVVLRLDQAGSAAFIVVALAAVPAFMWFGSVRLVLWTLGVALMAYALALGLLGVLMAFGLTRLASRNDQLTAQVWRSILSYPASADRPAPTARRRPGSPAERG